MFLGLLDEFGNNPGWNCCTTRTRTSTSAQIQAQPKSKVTRSKKIPHASLLPYSPNPDGHHRGVDPNYFRVPLWFLC